MVFFVFHFCLLIFFFEKFQMQENPDNVYAEVMAQCDQRFSSLCKSYCETFGKSLNSVTGKDEIIKEALDELQRNMQKVKDLVNS